MKHVSLSWKRTNYILIKQLAHAIDKTLTDLKGIRKLDSLDAITLITKVLPGQLSQNKVCLIPCLSVQIMCRFFLIMFLEASLVD